MAEMRSHRQTGKPNEQTKAPRERDHSIHRCMGWSLLRRAAHVLKGGTSASNSPGLARTSRHRARPSAPEHDPFALRPKTTGELASVEVAHAFGCKRTSCARTCTAKTLTPRRVREVVTLGSCLEGGLPRHACHVVRLTRSRYCCALCRALRRPESFSLVARRTRSPKRGIEAMPRVAMQGFVRGKESKLP